VHYDGVSYTNASKEIRLIGGEANTHSIGILDCCRGYAKLTKGVDAFGND